MARGPGGAGPSPSTFSGIGGHVGAQGRGFGGFGFGGGPSIEQMLSAIGIPVTDPRSGRMSRHAIQDAFNAALLRAVRQAALPPAPPAAVAAALPRPQAIVPPTPTPVPVSSPNIGLLSGLTRFMNPQAGFGGGQSFGPWGLPYFRPNPAMPGSAGPGQAFMDVLPSLSKLGGGRPGGQP